MTDAEIIRFVGLEKENVEVQERFLRTVTPEKRKLFDTMLAIEMWDVTGGQSPLPDGVLIDRPRRGKP